MTPGSADQCSVCDPNVVYFDGYYYLAYTATDDYRRNGMNNSAFVARSKNPDGPYEKWNGKGWGGSPKPFLKYDGDPNGWGTGEVSIVIMGRELYIYYTYFDTSGGETRLAKAEISENWPGEVELIDTVLGRTTQDSMDIIYADDCKCFMGFAIEDRMSDTSRVAVYVSSDGLNFRNSDSAKKYIEDYAHNIGIARSPRGHQNTDKEVLFGYAYGKRWGRWNLKFQHLIITDQVSYKVLGEELPEEEE